MRRFGPPQGPRAGPTSCRTLVGRLLWETESPGPAALLSNAGGPDGCWTDPREEAPTVFRPRVQCAFKLSMFSVFCNSHYDTQFASAFIDPKAE